MAYVAKSELKGKIPDQWIDGAMDDALTGKPIDIEAVWNQVSADIDEEINGRIGGRYSTPLSPVPDVIKAAAKVLACWGLWKRYGSGEAKNPWTDPVKDWRARLDRIGRGEEALAIGQKAASPAGSVISQKSIVNSSSGGLMV